MSPADRLDEIRARLAAAGGAGFTVHCDHKRIDVSMDAGCGRVAEVGVVLGHAPADLAFLLAEVDRITETCAALRALLAEARVSVEGDEWSAPVDLLDRIDAALAAKENDRE